MQTVTQKYRTAPVGSLIQHPRNPRQGDIGAIHESIDANGFYGAILVQKTTGHVLAGNHRLQAAIASGATRVPIIEIDVDDKTALRILTADNRVNDLAGYDKDALAALLTEIASTDSLHGTGFDGDDLDHLLSDLHYDDPNPDQATLTISVSRETHARFVAYAKAHATTGDALTALLTTRDRSR